MNCKTIVIELTNYLDDALDPILREALEKHLEKCKDCRLVVDTTKKTIQIYCNSDPAPLTDDTRQRLHQALEKKLRRARA